MDQSADSRIEDDGILVVQAVKLLLTRMFPFPNPQWHLTSFTVHPSPLFISEKGKTGKVEVGIQIRLVDDGRGWAEYYNAEADSSEDPPF